MKFEAVTIKDIAKALGLSTSLYQGIAWQLWDQPGNKKAGAGLCPEDQLPSQPDCAQPERKKKPVHRCDRLWDSQQLFSQIINRVESIAYNHWL